MVQVTPPRRQPATPQKRARASLQAPAAEAPKKVRAQIFTDFAAI
ncbi:hypothetical protein [Roseovarius aestuariivivens]|nr:hypothetical protein [Roseovarius aestuariivivens]